jgi:hypothetical protein
VQDPVRSARYSQANFDCGEDPLSVEVFEKA